MSRETWWLPSPDGEGTVVLGAHARGECAGKGCALHGPSNHWARDMPMEWSRIDGMQRICPHGVRHCDPDDAEFRWKNDLEVISCDPDNRCGCPCVCHNFTPPPPF